MNAFRKCVDDLCIGDRATHALRPLPRGEMLLLVTLGNLGSLLHNFLAFGEDELDVAGVGPGIILGLAPGNTTSVAKLTCKG